MLIYTRDTHAKINSQSNQYGILFVQTSKLFTHIERVSNKTPKRPHECAIIQISQVSVPAGHFLRDHMNKPFVMYTALHPVLRVSSSHIRIYAISSYTCAEDYPSTCWDRPAEAAADESEEYLRTFGLSQERVQAVRSPRPRILLHALGEDGCFWYSVRGYIQRTSSEHCKRFLKHFSEWCDSVSAWGTLGDD